MEYWLKFAHWVYDMQGLIGGVLALIAAILSMFWIHSHRNDSIKRKNIAMRSGMPIALSDISEYSEGYIKHCYELLKLQKNQQFEKPYVPKNICPDYPQEAFDKIQSVIESADSDTARCLSEFIALSQIQRSRVSKLLPSMNNTGRKIVTVSTESIYGHIYDALGINKFADRIYEYARLGQDRLEEFCDGDTATRKLRFLVFNDDEDLANLIVSRWPPSINR